MSQTFEQYIPEVFAWSYRVLGQYHDAMDVVQEVFIKWKHQCEKEVPRKPRGWLRTVCLNYSLDYRKRKPSLTEHTDDIADYGETPEVKSMDIELLRIDIHIALSELSESQRSIIVSKIYDSMTFAEIAEEQGISIPTAKTHYLRAIRAIRPMLLKKWKDHR